MLEPITAEFGSFASETPLLDEASEADSLNGMPDPEPSTKRGVSSSPQSSLKDPLAEVSELVQQQAAANIPEPAGKFKLSAPVENQLQQDRAALDDRYTKALESHARIYTSSVRDALSDVSVAVEEDGKFNLADVFKLRNALQDHLDAHRHQISSAAPMSDADRLVLSEVLGRRHQCRDLNHLLAKGTPSAEWPADIQRLDDELRALHDCLKPSDLPSAVAALSKPEGLKADLAAGAKHFDHEIHEGRQRLEQEWSQFQQGFEAAKRVLEKEAAGGQAAESEAADGGEHLDQRNFNRQVRYDRSRQIERTANSLKQANLSRNVAATLGRLTDGGSLYRDVKGYQQSGQAQLFHTVSETEKLRANHELDELKARAKQLDVPVDQGNLFQQIEALDDGSKAFAQLKERAWDVKCRLYRVGIPPTRGTASETQQTLAGVQVSSRDDHKIRAHIDARRQLSQRIDAAIQLENIRDVLGADDRSYPAALKKAIDADLSIDEKSDRKQVEGKLIQDRERLLASVQDYVKQQKLDAGTNHEETSSRFVAQVMKERLERGIYFSDAERNSKARGKRSDAALLDRAWSHAKGILGAHVGLKHDAVEIGASIVEIDSEAHMYTGHTENDRLTSWGEGLQLAECIFGMIGAVKGMIANWRKKPPIFAGIEAKATKNTVAYYRQGARAEMAKLRDGEASQPKPNWLRRYGNSIKAFLTRRGRKKALGMHTTELIKYSASLGAHTAEIAGNTQLAVTSLFPAGLGIASVLSLMKALENIGDYTADQEQIATLDREMRKVIKSFEDQPDLHRELQNIYRMYEIRRDSKQNLSGLAKNTVTAGAYGFATYAAGAGLAGTLTAGAAIAAPVAIGVGAATAIAHTVYKRTKAYCDTETQKLMQDALTGRVGETFAQQMKQAASEQGINPDEYLFERLTERDPRSTARVIVESLKREVHALSDEQITARIGAPRGEQSVDIYGGARTDEQKKHDEQRLSTSWAAQFLQTFAGMSAAQVLAIVDSDTAEDDLNAALVQHFMKV